MAESLNIALLSDEVGWHSEQLTKSFRSHGCQLITTAWTQNHFTPDDHGLHLTGFVEGLPDAVFVRTIPAGSLETVTFHLDILHALQRMGILVYNQAGMIERSVDKAMTSFLLKRAEIATPAMWSFVDWDEADKFMQSHDFEQKLVLKPMFGAQGKDIELMDSHDAWSDAYQRLCEQQRVCYLQSFVQSKDGSDWRVFVVGGKAIACMKRTSKGWIHNVAQGAECVAAPLQEDIADIAQRAVHAVGLFYAGVDIICDDAGKPWVIEMNSIPAWKGLQGVSDICIADSLVQDFLHQYEQYEQYIA